MRPINPKIFEARQPTRLLTTGEAKPCPFCGEQQIESFPIQQGMNWYGRNVYQMNLKCGGCGVIFGTSDGQISLYFEDNIKQRWHAIDGLVKKWNKRYEDEKVKGD